MSDSSAILVLVLFVVGVGYGLLRKGTTEEKRSDHRLVLWVFVGLPLAGMFISAVYGNNTLTTLIGIYLMIALFSFLLASAGNAVGAAFNRREGNSEGPRKRLCGYLSLICLVFGVTFIGETPVIGAPLLVLCALLYWFAKKRKPYTPQEK